MWPSGFSINLAWGPTGGVTSSSLWWSQICVRSSQEPLGKVRDRLYSNPRFIYRDSGVAVNDIALAFAVQRNKSQILLPYCMFKYIMKVKRETLA